MDSFSSVFVVFGTLSLLYGSLSAVTSTATIYGSSNSRRELFHQISSEKNIALTLGARFRSRKQGTGPTGNSTKLLWSVHSPSQEGSTVGD